MIYLKITQNYLFLDKWGYIFQALKKYSEGLWGESNLKKKKLVKTLRKWGNDIAHSIQACKNSYCGI